MKKALILILILGILCGCQNVKDAAEAKKIQWRQDHTIFISTLRYASGFSDAGFEWVLTFGNNKVVRIDGKCSPKQLLIGAKYRVYKNKYGRYSMEEVK